MSPSSDTTDRRHQRVCAVGALALAGLCWPVPAFAVPAASAAPVVPFEAAVVLFAGGTAELDGSTTLERTRTGTRSRIDCTILFAKDSDRLRPGAGERLRRLAAQLQQQGPGTIRVTGYTDDLGSAAHGLDLSHRRARQVANALSATLPTTTFPMTVRGRGEADPAVPNTSETNRRKNRRVTVILTITTPQPTATSQAQPPATTHPSPTATPTPAAPTAVASAPSPEPSTALTPGEPSTATTPAPTPHPIGAPFEDWPLLAGVGATLVLLGAVIDQIRRRPGTAKSPTPEDGPPPESSDPREAGRPAETDRAQSDDCGAAADTPPTATPDAAPNPPAAPTLSLPEGASNGAGRPAVTAPAVTAQSKPRKADLDADLTDWFSATTHRPRLTLLGPVHARTHGQALARRKPYYTELLAYLTLKPHGATIDEIADTFTLTTARVRTDMKVLRDWLGHHPGTGQPYLPDARTSPAALQRGLPTYQVQDVLCDYHLLTQLHTRATTTTSEARIPDLKTALRLVTGEPFSHTRANGWHWVFEGDRLDLHATTAIATVADAIHHGNHPAHQPAAAAAAAAGTS